MRFFDFRETGAESPWIMDQLSESVSISAIKVNYSQCPVSTVHCPLPINYFKTIPLCSVTNIIRYFYISCHIPNPLTSNLPCTIVSPFESNLFWKVASRLHPMTVRFGRFNQMKNTAAGSLWKYSNLDIFLQEFNFNFLFPFRDIFFLSASRLSKQFLI